MLLQGVLHSLVAPAFFTMAPKPSAQQIGPIREAAHHTVNVVFCNGLQDSPSELIFQKLYFRSGSNAELAPE